MKGIILAGDSVSGYIRKPWTEHIELCMDDYFSYINPAFVP